MDFRNSQETSREVEKERCQRRWVEWALAGLPRVERLPMKEVNLLDQKMRWGLMVCAGLPFFLSRGPQEIDRVDVESTPSS